MLCYDERLRKPEDPKAGLFRNKGGDVLTVGLSYET